MNPGARDAFYVLVVRPFRPCVTRADEMRDRHARGESSRELARAFHVSRSRVRRVLGLKSRRTR